ncbi:MAG: hypothetical protein R3F11_27145 [Verrucomicrobiales bacterium]
MKTKLLLLAAFLGAAGWAQAQTINWGSTASTTFAGNQSYLSDGSAMPDGFNFQLGWFDGATPGFSLGDPLTWADAWTAVDTTAFNYPSGIVGFSFQDSFNSVAALEGRQGYILGLDVPSLNDSPGEALLITSAGWVFPNISSPSSNDWTVANATTAIWGSIDTNIAAAGGEIAGGGTYTDDKAADTYHLQTAALSPVAPLPEPAAGFLALLAGGLAIFRRRR